MHPREVLFFVWLRPKERLDLVRIEIESVVGEQALNLGVVPRDKSIQIFTSDAAFSTSHPLYLLKTTSVFISVHFEKWAR